MNFDLSDELAELRQRVRSHVDREVIPQESTVLEEDRAGKHETLRRLQEGVRDAGLWAPHLPAEFGGLGLGIMGMCVLFREMGRSPIGARVFNSDAPDQGNMDLLLRHGTEALQARYLRPLCAAEITSAFCMTEPAPGAGADPSNLRTHARRVGEDFVIDGHKWYATGGRDASFLIVMARTSDDPKHGATMFVVDRHAEGVRHVREIPTMGEPVLQHREAEFRFEGVRVGPEAVLGGVGQGFRMAQARLVPARLTHCMRWLGMADRALELSRHYVTTRESFGKVLARHQMIQLRLAENASAIHAGNLMTFHCAFLLSKGEDKRARTYSSMAKVHVSRLLCKTLDDAIQMHGGLGYSDDLPFAGWYRHARAGRLADGPDEVHWMVIARDYLLGRVELLV
ncbi:MAG: acyl-CoA dehydrogenase family protein [Myxococcota bacterium]